MNEKRVDFISLSTALFVTLLWSSSFIIIKFGLADIPPLTFASLRYFTASLLLLSLLSFQQKEREYYRLLTKKDILIIVCYGILFYSVTQACQFFGLFYLEAITVSLVLSFTPLLVLFFSSFILKEETYWMQKVLVFIAFFGAILYFMPVININVINESIIGLGIISVGVIANAFSTIIGRSINKTRKYSPLFITANSMMVGSILLVITSLFIEEFSTLSSTNILYILWLSIVNTALAFTLWNKSMQKLNALEITIINNTMLLQITILAMIFLGEKLTTIQAIGLIIVGISAFLIQFLKRKKVSK